MLRTAAPADIDAILAVEAADPLPRLDPARVREDLALHRSRPGWTWLAEEQGRLTAFALWWAPSDARHPASLDHIWVSADVDAPTDVAAELLGAALDRFRRDGLATAPEVNLDLPIGWADDPAARMAVRWRRAACEANGITDWNERRQQLWTVDRPLPRDSGRLTYRPADDEAFLDVFRRVAVGSLDVLTQQTLVELGPQGQAQDDLDFYRSLPGDRDAWRLGIDRTGAVVGFAIPSRSAYDASVSYLGVAPEHRGHRYVDDLLAEITRFHAHSGATRITGTTDSTNAPMLDAFARAGYTTTGVRLVGSMSARTA